MLNRLVIPFTSSPSWIQAVCLQVSGSLGLGVEMARLYMCQVTTPAPLATPSVANVRECIVVWISLSRKATRIHTFFNP